jgi:hypothetical protein
LGFKRLERSEAVERFERLERTDPHDEPSAAVEPFDKTQGRLLERFERASVCVTDPGNYHPKSFSHVSERVHTGLVFQTMLDNCSLLE